ncbi:hypothetical protein GDO81_000491 [Engystomops pustulosus]|uniref:Transmembrane protein 154 n=2 Tax=Engystomops pustulosus TaxID=76066 RepID=A0AAV7D8R1_ENGPU|nr:hypothetical protein GDO81_000491 [Engystomops pustulosus]KAG8592412.1 hypothetical protein GDO81_000491 [Engystomops pustulosus]KAG8592413.1 hypothetical protein GDO81_000491 [Engystomops pustulosus]
MRKSSQINSKETGNVEVPLRKSKDKLNIEAEKIIHQMEETTTQDHMQTHETYPASTTLGDLTTFNSFNDTNSDVTEPCGVFCSDVTSILIYASPAIILVLMIPIIILIVQRKRRKKYQEDMPADQDLKSPIFEEDTPSVMEIEMDDLDKWMSNMKNSCRLSILEEEDKFPTSTTCSKKQNPDVIRAEKNYF